MKERIVFLLGAGAALDWYEAPKTDAITQTLIKSGFKNKKGDYVTDVIYQWLKKKTEKPSEINFETIINVIEDFIQYWSLDEAYQIHGLSYFIRRDSEQWADFLNFTLVSKGKIEIPGAGEVINLLGNIGDAPSPQAKYFELLLMEVLDSISTSICKYSFCTHEHYQVLNRIENQEINEIAGSYFKGIKDYHLRLYSLNYDRVIQYIFHRAGLYAFQGFSTKNLFPRLHEESTLDPLRILTDRDTNCIYHLHGNINWKVVAESQYQLPAYDFKLDYGPMILSNEKFAEIAIEKGKRLLVSNIITGYQKAQRTSLSPFRQMSSSFDLDCLTGDELIIIGYSFGDEHINDIIRNARKHNPKMRIKIVDPLFNEEPFLFNFLLHWGPLQTDIYKDMGEDRIIVEHVNMEIFKITFKKFMKRMGGNRET